MNQEHFLFCPKYRDLRDKFFLTEELGQMPSSMALHLLCPRSPWIDDLRARFLCLPDTTGDFASAPLGHGVQHLFTDGSHTDGRFETHRAAWGLHNATSNQPICSGHLAGLPQIIARAELSAVIAAIRWSSFWRVQVHMCLDALEIHKGLQQRLDGHRTSVADSNADLWIIVDELLACATDLVTTTWIPSHLDQTKCESPFEEWIAIHNGIANSLWHSKFTGCWMQCRPSKQFLSAVGISEEVGRETYQNDAEASQFLLCHV